MEYLSDDQIRSMADDWFGWLRSAARTDRSKVAVFGGIQEDPRSADLTAREYRLWERNVRWRLGQELSAKILQLSGK